MDKKYRLFIHMFTDDDAAILYGDKQFCLYGEDLKISKSFSSIHEMVMFIKTQINVSAGKAKEMCDVWLDTVVNCIINEDFDDIPTIAGNQEFEAYVAEIKPTNTAKIKLAYFKPSGKYYSDGAYNSKLSSDSLPWDYYNELREMFARGERPGLCDGEQEFYTLVDISERYDYPSQLIMPTVKEII